MEKEINNIINIDHQITKDNRAGKWASTRSALETPDVGGMV